MIFTPRHFGRRGYVVASVCPSVCLSLAPDCNEVVRDAFMDISLAFSRIWYSALPHKLTACGMQGPFFPGLLISSIHAVSTCLSIHLVETGLSQSSLWSSPVPHIH